MSTPQQISAQEFTELADCPPDRIWAKLRGAVKRFAKTKGVKLGTPPAVPKGVTEGRIRGKFREIKQYTISDPMTGREGFIYRVDAFVGKP